MAIWSNLAGRWKFDGNGNDSSGNGRNFTLTGTMPYVAGKLGTGCTPTSTNYWDIASPTWLDSQSAWSASFWCRDSALGSNECILSFGTAVSGGVIVFYPFNANGGDGFSSFCKGTTAIKLTNNHPAPDSNWHHISLVCENSASFKVYIDGTLETTHTTNNYTTPASMTNLRVGMYHNGSQSYSGDIDDLWIHLRALTQSDVRELMSYRDGYPVVTIR